jgi:hypothetical protein
MPHCCLSQTCHRSSRKKARGKATKAKKESQACAPQLDRCQHVDALAGAKRDDVKAAWELFHEFVDRMVSVGFGVYDTVEGGNEICFKNSQLDDARKQVFRKLVVKMWGQVGVFYKQVKNTLQRRFRSLECISYCGVAHTH